MTDTLEQRLAHDLHRTAASTTVPLLPTVDPAAPADRRRRRPGRRRALIAAAIATAGVAVAVPVAAAAGALAAISVAFGWTHQPPLRGGLPVIAANNATGRRVLTVPGPPGETMQIWVADAVGGGQCVSLLEPVAGGYHSLGGECGSAGSTPATIDFGGGGDLANGWITFLSAPGAAYVTLADGLTTRKIPVADGVSAAWLPPVDQNRPLTLTAYTAAGTLIGTSTRVAFLTPPPPGQRGDPDGPHTSPGPPGLGS